MKECLLLDKDNLIIGVTIAAMAGKETNKKVKVKLQITKEMGELNNHKKQMEIYANSSKQERKSAQINLMRKRTAEAEKNHKNFLEYENKIQETMALMMPLLLKIEKMRKDLTFSEAVYFEQKEGEKLISPEEATEIRGLLADLGENKRLKEDKTEIDDYRGWKGYEKINDVWTEKEITDINDVPGSGKLASELTPGESDEVKDQLQLNRINALSSAEKDIEKASIIENLSMQAAQKRSAMEIQGKTSAKSLTDSKAWYDAEAAKVEAKYSPPA